MPNPNARAVERALAYARSEEGRFLEELFDFLRIPSISALPAHREDVRRAGEFLAGHLKALGFPEVRVYATEGHPIVYGEYSADPSLPTVLFYGHYDVQPVDPEAEWTTPPFAPEVRDGAIYARGASDDKGQVWLFLKAVESFLRGAGGLPVNLKVLLEGEEEIGSPNLVRALARERETWRADVVLVADTGMPAPGRPAITVGLRGICGLEIRVRGAQTDLHSGEFGGIVRNPIQALVELLARFHDAEGRVAVPGFYDEVRPLTREEREAIRALSRDEHELARTLGVPELYGEAGFSYLERNWARPTLEFNGIGGGFQGQGTKTVIPREAFAKITCRLVPDQDPERIRERILAFVEENAPRGVVTTVATFDSGPPYVVDPDHPAIAAAARSLAATFGNPPVFVRMGGSIPIAAPLAQNLNAPVVFMGFGLPDDRIHAPDEHFRLEQFTKGLEAMIRALAELGEGSAS
ncbi:MAG: Acetylornithine deacetylase [Brockia lithotrophica]|uniref:Acetylornithine deacetylase n=1 Tax=Brockia lithotrophica TaxID=933949 RepID=A0A2T5GAH0_9BACL|nr:MAG: Acetylornithine deacetylase [Brockia lithotrophica]